MRRETDRKKKGAGEHLSMEARVVMLDSLSLISCVFVSVYFHRVAFHVFVCPLVCLFCCQVCAFVCVLWLDGSRRPVAGRK